MKSTKATVSTLPGKSKPGELPARLADGTVQQDTATKTLIIGACSVAVISLLVFVNCLANGWVFDDYLHVLDSPELRSLSNVFRLLRHYRPLRDISYALDFGIWGESTVGFHFTNIALHSANAVLVFLLSYRLFGAGNSTGSAVRPHRGAAAATSHSHLTGDLWAAVLASLIFAVHPIQTDSVAYVSGRRDLLFSLFYLAAFYLYLSYRQRPSWKLLSVALASWILSLMSQEMAAIFPAVVFLWNYTGAWEHTDGSWFRRLVVSGRTVLRREWWLYLGMIVVVTAYSYYDIVGQHASGRAGPGGLKYWGGGLYPNLLTELRVQGWFLKQLIYPTPIAQYLGAFPISTSILDWRVILSGVVVLSTIGAGIFALGRWRLVSFAVLSYFAILLPVSQIVPHHELLADHYLYLPIFAFALLVSLGARAVARQRERRLTIAYAAAACIVLVFAVLTVRQNAVWKDDRTFWEANYAKVPDSPRAVYSLAGLYISLNPRKAQEMYRRCLTLDPTYGQAYISLATLVNNRADAQAGEGLVQAGLDIPEDRVQPGRSVTAGQFRAQLKTALAILKGAVGDQSAAESLLWEAVSDDPTNPQPYDMLAKFYAKDKDKQTDLYIRELSAIPDSIPTREGLVFLLVKDQKYDEAIPYLNGILSINSNDVFANYQMGQICRTRKECARARAYLKKAGAAATRASDVGDVKDAMKQLVKECGSE